STRSRFRSAQGSSAAGRRSGTRHTCASPPSTSSASGAGSHSCVASSPRVGSAITHVSSSHVVAEHHLAPSVYATLLLPRSPTSNQGDGGARGVPVSRPGLAVRRHGALVPRGLSEIGRASCRERGGVLVVGGGG